MRRRPRGPSTRHVLVGLGAASAAVVGLVGAATVLAAAHLADREAARTSGQRVAQVAGVAGALADDLDEPPERERFDEAVRREMQRAGVTHLRLWDDQGRIVWSDQVVAAPDRPVVGADFPTVLNAHDVLVLPTDTPGEVEDLDRPAAAGYEVYDPVTTPSGRPLLVEGYTDDHHVAAIRHHAMSVVLPVSLGALLLGLAAALLTAITLVRRLVTVRQDRHDLLVHTVASAELERTRLAQDLHDGVVQDLAAVRYGLESIVDDVPAGLPEEPHERLQVALGVLERDLGDLRGMLGELTPPDFSERNLELAVQALVRHLLPTELSCTVRVDMDAVDAVDHQTAQLAYRTVREGLRNVVRHARARAVLVELETAEDARGRVDLRVAVTDDGVGAGPAPAAPADGHFGLRLLGSVVRAAGGDLRLDSPQRGGTTLRVTLPVRKGRAAEDPLTLGVEVPACGGSTTRRGTARWAQLVGGGTHGAGAGAGAGRDHAGRSGR